MQKADGKTDRRTDVPESGRIAWEVRLHGREQKSAQQVNCRDDEEDCSQEWKAADYACARPSVETPNAQHASNEDRHGCGIPMPVGGHLGNLRSSAQSAVPIGSAGDAGQVKQSGDERG